MRLGSVDAGRRLMPKALRSLICTQWPSLLRGPGLSYISASKQSSWYERSTTTHLSLDLTHLNFLVDREHAGLVRAARPHHFTITLPSFYHHFASPHTCRLLVLPHLGVPIICPSAAPRPHRLLTRLTRHIQARSGSYRLTRRQRKYSLLYHTYGIRESPLAFESWHGRPRERTVPQQSQPYSQLTTQYAWWTRGEQREREREHSDWSSQTTTDHHRPPQTITDHPDHPLWTQEHA